MTGQPPIEPYKAQVIPFPDIMNVEQQVVDEPHGGHEKAAVATGVALGLVIVGSALWLVRDHSDGEGGQPPVPPMAESVTGEQDDLCYSPIVEQTFEGDPSVTSGDPTDWKKGVLVNEKPGNVYGVRIGFHGEDKTRDETTDPTQWAWPIEPEQLSRAPAVMRTGPKRYTVVVQNIGWAGTDACYDKPNATLTPVDNVLPALKKGGREPHFD
jgi:hypothetical protein